MTGCFFAQLPGAGPCDGQLVNCHLIDKQWIRIAFPKGAVLIEGRWQPPVEAWFLKDTTRVIRRSLAQLQEDERAWVRGCGGLSGVGGHHGQTTAPHDRTRLHIPRDLLPAAVEEYAAELGLLNRLNHRYGPRASVAA